MAAPTSMKISVLILSTLSSALRVTSNSPCSSLCKRGSISSINGANISCDDAQFSEVKGQGFKKCLECLETSDFGTDEENDQEGFIYNLRFATDCGYPT